MATKSFKGIDYETSVGGGDPKLVINGTPIHVMVQPNGEYAAHGLLRSYDTLDEIAQRFIMFDPRFMRDGGAVA